MTRLLTKKDVADLLQYSTDGINRLMRNRRIPYIKIGKTVRFKKDDIENWIDKRKIKTT